MGRFSLGALAVLISALSVSVVLVRAEDFHVDTDDDFESACLMRVQPGDTCYLADGDHYHDGLTRTHGTESARITITSENSGKACIRGSNTQDRVLQIAHNYYTVEDLCFDGDHGDSYVATAIYVLGEDEKKDLDHNGVTVKSSVTGLQLFDLEIKNFHSECVHFRYSVTWAEVSGCTVQHCGIDAFENGGGGKVGECFYIGTALDQISDSKAPEPKLRSGSADNGDVDKCAYNWIHHNTMRSYGNECVDVKEGSSHNLIESNVCENQMDEDSGCFGLRGSDNTLRWNEIAECKGAGVRMGGNLGYGGGNHIYENVIKEAKRGAFSVMSPDQGTVCGNKLSGVDRIAYGSDSDQSQFSESNATGDCDSHPGNHVGSDTPSPSGTDYDAGVNNAPDAGGDSSSELFEVEPNDLPSPDMPSRCGSPVGIEKVSLEHDEYVNGGNHVDNIVDGKISTYLAIHRESTQMTFELDREVEIDAVAIGFFMKDASEERIMTFDVEVKRADDDDWRTVRSRAESSGDMDIIEYFSFSPRTALYVRFSSHGNTFNNWTALTEFNVCARATGESNALFGGAHAIEKELEALAGEICAAPKKVAPVSATASGSKNVRYLFDGNYNTRWSTIRTQDESDLNNGMVTMTFPGDTRVSTLKIAFFDGDLANQFFSVYVQKADADVWTQVIEKQRAAKRVGMQSFPINMDGVHKLYIVGNGNSIGLFSKFSEVEVLGC